MAEASRLERILSVLLTIATVTVAAVVVEGRLRPRQIESPGARTEFIADWATISSGAVLPLGGPPALVDVVVFTDFECPYCKHVDSVLTQLELRLPGKISRSIVHFPLSMHRDAFPAALAQECAAAQGRVAEMHHVLYGGQRDFGRRSWNLFAAEAGVTDTVAFSSCMRGTADSSRVHRGLFLADSLRLSGTPVVVINGWLFDPGNAGTVERAVLNASKGRSPR